MFGWGCSRYLGRVGTGDEVVHGCFGAGLVACFGVVALLRPKVVVPWNPKYIIIIFDVYYYKL